MSSPVHYNDFMLYSNSDEDIARYADGARRFVEILDRSLDEAGRNWEDVRSALEVGCGYGRIVRELRAQHPRLEIAVNDVIDEGARFTERTFKASRLPLLEEMKNPPVERFDLVYLLSVYTHMPRKMIERSLSLVSAALRPRGIVVFTIHGEGSAKTAERYEQFWLEKDMVLQGMNAEGYYYERYPYYTSEYGLTWFAPKTLKALVKSAAPQLTFVSHHPMDLDGHQDIFVYQRDSTAPRTASQPQSLS